MQCQPFYWLIVIIIYFLNEYFVENYCVCFFPFSDGLGKEVVSRFSTDLDTEKTWYIDANGREMQKRV